MINFIVNNIKLLDIWIYRNPNITIFLMFCIALIESIIIVGNIFPGSIFMNTVGIVIGSTGITRIYFSFLFIVLGSVIGDEINYVIGYLCKDKIINFWPFKKYPNFILYGKFYFTRHGNKSLVISKIFGPFRSIMPVIAGIFNMNYYKFLFSTIFSSVIWFVIYILPGMYIGFISRISIMFR